MSLSKSLKASDKDMEAAIQAFKDWRRTREKRCRIPEQLWEMAANLSTNPHYPLTLICNNLGLNWGDLKKKIDQLSSNHPVKTQKGQQNTGPHTSPSFIELKLNSQERNQTPSLLLNHSPSPHSYCCAIELTKPDGKIMKIFASNDAPLNLLELFKTFLVTGGD